MTLKAEPVKPFAIWTLKNKGHLRRYCSTVLSTGVTRRRTRGSPISLCVSRDAPDLYVASALSQAATDQATTAFRLAADTGIIRQAIRVEPDATGLALPTSAVWVSGSQRLQVLSASPAPDAVINRASGVQQIVVQYDRPVSISAIQVTGASTGVVAGGVLVGNGTDRYTLSFPTRLPDRDRYTVVVTADSVIEQWEFVTLIGDCNLDQSVNIFDLGMMRTLLRNGLYDATCDIDENARINILDLGHVRRGLRDGAHVE